MENKSHRKIDRCRSCGFGELKPILSLGDLYVSNFVDAPVSASDDAPYPLALVLCESAKNGCGLLQLEHTVSPQKMYRNYWYRSGVNKTMVDELNSIAKTVENIISLANGDIVVDIGCNDGTLLRAYTKEGIRRVGFEPASNLMDHARQGTDHVFNDFFAHAPFQKEFGDRKAKVITAIAMFYDLDDPNGFLADIKKTLDKDGLFIIQMTDSPSMLVLNAFDNICHEHLEYYSLAALEHLLNRHGLEVFDLETNNINGGSLRVYARHQGSRIGNNRAGRQARYQERLAFEEKLGLNGADAYEQFAERVGLLGKKLSEFIKNEKARGKKIYVYGASTKGNTLLQFLGLDHKVITAAAERNPIKWGKKTIGTNIPIISEEQARKEKPDYFLVLPWHFRKEFLEREKEYLTAGGKFIFPLPEFEVIGINDLSFDFF